MMTAAEIVRELHSAVCPSCHAPKEKKAALCSRCYVTLPEHMRAELRLPIGKGFEAAYENARRCAKQRRVPASGVRAGRHTRQR